MPSDDRTADSICKYQQILGKSQQALESNNVPDIICLGDFNADPNRGRFWPFLQDFISSNKFLSSAAFLPLSTFTYLSPAHNTTS